MASTDAATGRSIARRIVRSVRGPVRLRLGELADQVAELTRVANDAAAKATAALELAEAAHHAVAEGDPQATRELVVTTRDEVKRLTIDITEQLNSLSTQARPPVAHPGGAIQG